MAPNNDAVFLRRNNQIQDAIDGQNLKQALQLIEKRMKKGENTPFLKTWKAHVQTRMPDEAHQQRGIAETLEICESEPPVTDLETLSILIQTLKSIGGHEEAQCTLWEKAAKAKSQDRDIQLRWFTYAYEEDNWKSAQKAAMSLQKNFPRERKFYFWAIFTSFLIASDENSSEMDRKLFGTLAYRMILKAVEDVSNDSDQPSNTSRSIQDSEEMMLLLQVLQSQGRFAESVKLLDSESVGIQSQIINNDKEFIRLKTLNLGSGKLWEQSLEFVKDFYSVSDGEEKRKNVLEFDDWVIWNLLIQSARNIGTKEAISDARSLVESVIDFNPKSRNASLALLDVMAINLENGQMDEDAYAELCKGYIDRHGHRVFAFGDIQRLLGGNKLSMAKILEYVNEKKDTSPNPLVSTINALKLEYSLKISGADGKPSRELIEDFVSRCLKLYSDNVKEQFIEKTEAPPRDDLPMLAVMAIFSEDGNTDSPVPGHILVRSIAIIERLLRDSPHNSNALLVLQRIYLLLGAGSLAISTFNKLSVKQMQYETVAYNLFTRLSTIHPHSAPPVEGVERSDFDPQAAFVKALNFFRSSDVTTMRFRSRGLDEGAYSNLKELVDLRGRLARSICRRMWALHLRQAQRIVGGDSTARFDEIAKNALPANDSRNSTAYMSCEFPGKPAFECRLRAGPLPKENWMNSSRLADQLFAVLKNIAIQKPLTPDADLPDLGSLSLADEVDRTEIEEEAFKINSELLKVATFLAGSKATSAEQVDKSLAVVEDWLNEKVKYLTLEGNTDSEISELIKATTISLQPNQPAGPTWAYFHVVFTLLETLKALSQLTLLASRKSSTSSKISKERLGRLAAIVPEVFELVRSNTRALKNHISAPGVLGALVDTTVQGNVSEPYSQDLQKHLEDHVGAFDLELICGALKESWEEALNGVMRVRL